MNRAGAALLALLILAGCADKPTGKRRQTDAVLYTIGLSTDPYGESRPRGFGIATGVTDDRLEKVEVRESGLGGFGGAEWLDLSTVVVPRPAPPLRRPLIYRYDGVLKRQGDAPISGGANYDWSPVAKTAGLPIWSPDQRYFAAVASCCGVVIAHANGEVVQTIRTKLTDSMIAWSPVGRRLAFTTSGFPDPHQLFVLRPAFGPAEAPLRRARLALRLDHVVARREADSAGRRELDSARRRDAGSVDRGPVAPPLDGSLGPAANTPPAWRATALVLPREFVQRRRHSSKLLAGRVGFH